MILGRKKALRISALKSYLLISDWLMQDRPNSIQCNRPVDVPALCSLYTLICVYFKDKGSIEDIDLIEYFAIWMYREETQYLKLSLKYKD